MKIDRHNYEEFFILYWDNELTAAQKQAVEDFINQNADLREEFEIFGETRFAPDAAVQFKEKGFLVNDSFVNITNYQEQLLNYIDDEVTPGERKEIEEFVSLNPAAQNELALLQKTKLQPEAEISFPDKSVLYKREEKPVRIISMVWFRVAVAAAIILIAGLTIFQLLNPGNTGNVNPVAKIDESKNVPAEKNETVPENQNANEQQQDIANADKYTVKDQPDKKAFDKTPVKENALAINSTNQPENKNNLPKPGNNVIVNDQDAKTEEALAYNPVSLEKVDKVQIRESDDINISLPNTDVTIKPELALYIPEQEAKEKDGGGLKEFLRKTTRVFERRTKIQTTTEDNKLLVGAFAVSLK